MAKLKSGTTGKITIVILIFIVVGLILTIVMSGTKTETTAGMTPQGIKKIAELSTLQYDYKDVIVIEEQEEFMLFGIVDIDPGEHILIASYSGTIKLGIDCKEIKINEQTKIEGQKTKVYIKLPEIKIISHETPFDSVEILYDKGVYTEKTVQKDAMFDIAAERQKELSETIMNSEIAEMARENAKEYLLSLFNSFSEIEENYEIIFVD